MSISKERLLTGEPGEIAMFSWVDKKNTISKWMDVRENDKYKLPDIDCLANDLTKGILKIEAKTDTFGGKNFCFQLRTLYTDREDLIGWFFRSEADILTIYDQIHHILYVFQFNELREWYQKNSSKRFTIKFFPDKQRPGISSECVLIPKTAVLHLSRQYTLLLPMSDYKFQKEVQHF